MERRSRKARRANRDSRVLGDDMPREELHVELLTLPSWEWPEYDDSGLPLTVDTDDLEAVREFLEEHAEKQDY